MSRIFTYRSYTPIPFLLLMLIFAEPTVTSFIVGYTMAILGELLRFWGVSWAGSETRTTAKAGGTFLIVSGPFARLRNPLYLGNIFLYTGIGVASLALFPYLTGIAFLFFCYQYYTIVQEEEAYLLSKYADAFKNYCAEVPAFIPRFTAYKNPGLEQPPRNIKAGFRSERRSLQAFTIVTLLLLLTWYLKNSYDWHIRLW